MYPSLHKHCPGDTMIVRSPHPPIMVRTHMIAMVVRPARVSTSDVKTITGQKRNHSISSTGFPVCTVMSQHSCYMIHSAIACENT